MTATSEGNKKGSETKLKNDPDYFRKIGALGHESWKANGRKPRGFSTVTPEQRREWGRMGGKKGKRKAL